MGPESRDGPGDDGYLDDVLRAAFRDESEAGESALEAIERETGAVSRVLLRDAPDDASPVIRVLSSSGPDAVRGDRRYQILGEIARGGVGVIFKGRDRDLGRPVALKVLRAEHRGDVQVTERFVEEAQIGGQLQHPGIVPVYGLGLEGDGRPYFAMKLVKGVTLGSQLDDRSDLVEDRRRLLGVFEQVTQTMAYAHARGVIHRDLKPSNVMIGAFGEVQVVDWGFAKVLGTGERKSAEPATTVVRTVRTGPGSTGSESVTGSVMGTPAYMPPEQALGQVEDLDERADVFALGAILTEILTGEPPYTGEPNDRLIKAMHAKLDDAHDRLDACGADPEIVDLARRCLAPVRDERPRDAGALAKVVTDHLETVEARARREQLAAAEERAKAEEEGRRLVREREREAWERRARKRTMLTAGAALLAIVVGGGIVLWKDGADRARETAAEARVGERLRDATEFSTAGDWDAALEAAKLAVAEARTVGADDATLAEAEAAFTSIETGARVARDRAKLEAEDAEFVARLEGIGFQRFVTMDARRDDRHYAETFRKHGIDVDELTVEEAAERIRGRTRPVEIAAALDVWASVCREKTSLRGRDWRRLLSIASLADPDFRRDTLRDAMSRDDDESLRSLAASVRVDEWPLATIRRLGVTLGAAGRFEVAADLLRRVEDRHPDDLWTRWALGWSLQQLRRSEEALLHYTAALALCPDHSYIFQNIGAAHLDLGRRQTAHDYFLRAAASQPGSGLSHASCAWYVFGRDPEAAEEACRRALDLSPDDSQVLIYVARTFDRMRRHDRAEEVLQRLLERHGDTARAQNAWGTHLCDFVMDHVKAEEAFRKAIEIDSTCAAYHSNLGHALKGQKRLDEAIDEYRRAVALDERNGFWWDTLGTGLWVAGRTEEAREALSKAVELTPHGARIRTDWGEFLWRIDNDTEAAEIEVRKALELDRDLPHAHDRLGHILVQQKRYGEAEAAFREALLLDPRLAGTWGNLGAVLANFRGDHQRAVDAYRRALEIDPDSVFARCNLGTSLNWLRRYSEALVAFDTVLKIEPTSAPALGGRAFALWQLGRLEEAEAAYGRALELWGKNSGRWFNYARLLLAMHRPEKAVAAARKAAGLAPESPASLGTLAEVLFVARRYREAIDAFNATIALEPDSSRAAGCYSNICLARGLLGQARAAIEAADRAVKLAPRAPKPAHLRGVLQSSEMGDFETAEESIRQAIALDPRVAYFRRGLAAVLIHQGRLEEALETIEDAIRLDPDNPSHRGARAKGLFLTGQADAARGEWRAVIAAGRERCRGDSPGRDSLVPLALLLADCPDVTLRAPEEAIEWARRAVKSSPEELFARRALALASIRAGRAEAEAVATLTDLREACDGPRRHADLDLLLALAHAGLGRMTEARKMLDRAVAWIDEHAPRDPDLKRYRAEAEALIAGRGR
jgi:serine/threonine-protein kinase